MSEQPMLPGMPADQPQRKPADNPDFSTAEKIAGATAAYRAPVATGVAASALLQRGTDPARRADVTTVRTGAVVWLIGGVLIAVLAFGLVVSLSQSHGADAQCRGGADTLAPFGPDYRSDDGTNWTVTYPCLNGGETTAPIARNKVPGGGR